MPQRARTTHGDQLIAYIEKHLKRFDSNLAKVFERGDAEAVHDVRVASRRLTEPLRLIGEWIGRKEAGRVIRLLRRARCAMRRTRELDVLQAAVAASAREFGGLEPSDLAQLEGVLTQQRERAVARGRRRCKRLAADEIGPHVCRLADRFAASVDADGDLLVEQNVEQLFRCWGRRVLDADARLETTDLHQTRLCAKRFRYSAELLRDIGGRHEAALLEQLVRMQDLLGHWNDQLAAARRISGIARRRKVLARQSDWAARLLSYAAQLAASAEGDRRSTIEAWPAFEAAVRLSLSERDEADVGRQEPAPNGVMGS